MFRKIAYKYAIPFFPLVVSIVGYFRWVNFRIFFAGDYLFLSEAAQHSSWSLSTWNGSTNLGAVNILLWRTPIDALYALLGRIGFDYNVVDKFLLLWPVIILLPLASYLLLGYLVKNRLAASVGSFVICFNTYFLAINTQGHLLLTLGAALGLFSFYFYFRWLDENKRYLLILLLLFIVAVGSIDLRSLYMTLGVIMLHVLYSLATKTITRRQVLSLLGLLGGFVILSLYWLIPLFSSGGLNDTGILSRSLFGSEFWTLGDALALHHPFWNGGEPNWFVTNPIPLYFWIIPISAFSGMVCGRKNRIVVFFGFITLIGVVLGKQLDQPFGTLSQFLFDNFPGFSAFRESTKFYFLISTGYAVLIAFLVRTLLELKISNKVFKSFRYVVPIAVVAVMLVNLKPMLTGDIGSMYESRQKPNDYVLLDDFLNKQPDYFRVLWMPRVSKWVSSTNTHPWASSADLISEDWREFAVNPEAELNADKMLDFISRYSTRSLLEQASFKYVVVPLVDQLNDDDPFVFYESERDVYIDKLDSIDWLVSVDINMDDALVYENVEYKPHIFAYGTVFDAPDLRNLDEYVNFFDENYAGSHAFTTDTNSNSYIRSLNSLFDSPSITENSSGVLIADEFSVSPGTEQEIYKNVGNTNLSYTLKNSEIVIKSEAAPDISIDDRPTLSRVGYGETIFTGELNLDGLSFLRINNQSIRLDADQEGRIGDAKDINRIEINNYGENAIVNGSFEDGLWADQVGDCFNYDDAPDIDMGISNESSDGRQALQLIAKRHFACTSTEVDLEDNTEYLFSFDYRSPGAADAGFYLQFNDDARTVVSDTIEVNQPDLWKSLFRNVTTPKGASKATIFLYAYESDDNSTNTVIYDNVFIGASESTQQVDISGLTDKFELVANSSTNGSHKVSILGGSEVSPENLIANSSFEENLWTEVVADCYRYDSNPDLYVLPSLIASSGLTSLELGATRHNACISTFIEFQNSGSYRLSFDVSSPNNSPGGYFMQFNDEDSTVFSKRVEIINENDWQTYEEKITVPAGATSAVLYVYAYESDGVSTSIVRYDDFKFTKLPDLDDIYYVTAAPIVSTAPPSEIKFHTISSTKYKAAIVGAERAFVLGFAESYHEKWKVYLAPVEQEANCLSDLHVFDEVSPADTKVTECANDLSSASSDLLDANAQQIEIDGYANGWIIDPQEIMANTDQDYYTVNSDGSIDINIVIDFTSQAGFRSALSLTGLAMVSLTLILAWSYKSESKRS